MMVDRFEQPDFEPETPEEHTAGCIRYYELRKAAERIIAEKLEKAAKRAAETGNRKDLREYLRLRRILLWYTS